MKAVGMAFPLNRWFVPKIFKATTMKAGWGDTWEEAFKNYEKKHGKTN